MTASVPPTRLARLQLRPTDAFECTVQSPHTGEFEVCLDSGVCSGNDACGDARGRRVGVGRDEGVVVAWAEDGDVGR